MLKWQMMYSASFCFCSLLFLGSPIWKPRDEDQEVNGGNVVSSAVESLQSASKGY